MKKIYLIFVMLFFTFLLFACDEKTNEQKKSETNDKTYTIINGNPTPEEVLKNDKNADILFIDGIVYENAGNIEHIQKLDLTLKNKLGKIKKNSSDSSEFENFSASKLPVGAEIYTTEIEHILIAVVNNQQIRYAGLIEG